jgi:hypothetical protein
MRIGDGEGCRMMGVGGRVGDGWLRAAVRAIDLKWKRIFELTPSR